MLANNTSISDGLSSPVRNIKGKVEHYRNSTLLNTYTQSTALQQIEIQRVAENSKFFGMVISARINVKLRDMGRVIDIQSGDYLVPYLGVENNYISYAKFVITEINRDEKTNQLSITGYDLIDDLKNHKISEITLTAPYTTTDVINAIATFAGTTYEVRNINDVSSISLTYTNGANLEGTETVKEVLQAIAEATQTVIFVDYNNKIVLKRLSPTESSVLTITKSLYTDLSSKTNRRLVGVAHITELGDNVEAKLQLSGTTQNVYNNPFWEMREDIGTIVDNALAAVGELTLNQFSCSWIGNVFLEIGDKIALITKDNETIYSYVLDDVITYDGSLQEKTQWNYTEDEGASTNPSSIGDVLKQTYARVDKQGKEIELVASNVTSNSSQIASLQLTTGSISATVSNYQTDTNSILASMNDELQSVKTQVSTAMTDTQIQVLISEAIESSVQQVATETGFTFDKDGLLISKSGSEMTTRIDEDGMNIDRSGTNVLTVDNTGVNALNLTARQYLIIGSYTRIEDYGTRTGAFWIGG